MSSNPFDIDTRGTRIAWGLILVIEVLGAVLLFGVLTGCRSAHAVVPEASAVVTVRPDTVVRITSAPLPPVRVQTFPERVVEYRKADTSSTSTDVTAIVATRETITVRTRKGEQTFRQPATGETLVLQAHRSMSGADTAGAFVGGVAGRQQRVVVPQPRVSAFERITRLGHCLLGVLFLLVVALILSRIRA